MHFLFNVLKIFLKILTLLLFGFLPEHLPDALNKICHFIIGAHLLTGIVDAAARSHKLGIEKVT